MPRLRAADRFKRDRPFERDESSSAVHGERKQVDVGELTRTMDASCFDNGRIEQADLIRPEFVDVALGRRRESLDHELRRHGVRISGV
jgi:hypothetical protein